MNFWAKLIEILQTEATCPTSYGWFHLVWVAIIIASTVSLCYFYRNADDKQYRKIMLIMWVAMVAFETFKQLMYIFSVSDGVVEADYSWYVFPFQLCGTPLFVLPFIIWGKDSSFRDAIMAFICIFSFFGGLVTYIYPEEVFIAEVGISLQSMFHHGSQIVIGIFTITHLRKRYDLSLYKKGAIAFTALCGVALILDVVGYKLLRAAGMDDTFNMFFISPYFECSLPVLDKIDQALPYVPFLALYIFGFLLIGFVMFWIQKGCIKLATRKHS